MLLYWKITYIEQNCESNQVVLYVISNADLLNCRVYTAKPQTAGVEKIRLSGF